MKYCKVVIINIIILTLMINEWFAIKKTAVIFNDELLW